MAHFTPEFYETHHTDHQRGVVTVVAQGSVSAQAFLAGSSPEDSSYSARAVGHIDLSDFILQDDISSSVVHELLDTIDNWEVL